VSNWKVTIVNAQTGEAKEVTVQARTNTGAQMRAAIDHRFWVPTFAERTWKSVREIANQSGFKQLSTAQEDERFDQITRF
jgi:hypothetical protein